MDDFVIDNIERIVDDIVGSYLSVKRTQRVGETALPSRERIIAILDECRILLYPGYFGHKRLTWDNVKYHVGNLLMRLGQELAEEIRHCMCSGQPCEAGRELVRCRDDAAALAKEFLARVPKLRDLLAADAQAAYDGDPAAKGIDEVIYCYPGYYAVMVYRIAHELRVLGVPLMPRIMTEYAHSVTGADIHPGAEIDQRFFIDHATGVVVGETTRIGKNVKIYQGVTLGAKSFPKDERGRLIKGLQRHPTIEDDVTIYPNATILGGETVIGRGSTIGGNTYVFESVSPGSLVRQEAPRLEVLTKHASSK